MKRIILSMAAVAALATALPAAAQGYNGHGFGDRGGAAQTWGHRFDDQRIEQRIDQGVRDGSLTRGEARGLRNQLREDRRLEAAYMRDELNSLTALRRQVPGRMGLGTDQAAYKPPPGWTPPKRPDPMTSGHKPGGRKRS